MLENIIKGNSFSSETILERILDLFTSEIKASISIALKIVAVSVICSLLKNIQVHNNNNVGESAIASKVDFAGKVIIVTMSLPILTTLLETVTEVI